MIIACPRVGSFGLRTYNYYLEEFSISSTELDPIVSISGSVQDTQVSIDVGGYLLKSLPGPLPIGNVMLMITSKKLDVGTNICRCSSIADVPRQALLLASVSGTFFGCLTFV